MCDVKIGSTKNYFGTQRSEKSKRRKEKQTKTKTKNPFLCCLVTVTDLHCLLHISLPCTPSIPFLLLLCYINIRSRYYSYYTSPNTYTRSQHPTNTSTIPYSYHTHTQPSQPYFTLEQGNAFTAKKED